MKKILKFIKNVEGQALVESALVLTFVLIPLILGMIELGWILNGQITLTSAAREGARAAVIYKSKEDASEVVLSAVKNSGKSSSLDSDTVTSDTEFVETTLPSGKKRSSAIVTVSAKIKPIIGLYVPVDSSGYFTLTAKAEMLIE